MPPDWTGLYHPVPPFFLVLNFQDNHNSLSLTYALHLVAALWAPPGPRHRLDSQLKSNRCKTCTLLKGSETHHLLAFQLCWSSTCDEFGSCNCPKQAPVYKTLEPFPPTVIEAWLCASCHTSVKGQAVMFPDKRHCTNCLGLGY